MTCLTSTSFSRSSTRSSSLLVTPPKPIGTPELLSYELYHGQGTSGQALEIPNNSPKPVYSRTASTTSCTMSQEEQNQETQISDQLTSKGKQGLLSIRNISKITKSMPLINQTITNLLSNSSQQQDEMTPSGEASISTLTVVQTPQDHNRSSISRSSSSTQSTSLEEGGSLRSQALMEEVPDSLEPLIGP